ncbi:MAG: hypothetical protein EXR70_03560 [Deltaproteobacteria bacterium]|nr:hypothetical protein [Deltaproteobacteria bacterium]
MEETAGFCAIVDLTAKLKEHIRDAKIDAGTATLFVSGSTAALTTIEHDDLLDFDNRPRRREIIVQLIGEKA